MTTDILNKPARYRWAALKMCQRAEALALCGSYARAHRCLRAASRLNHLAYRAA